MLLAGQCCSFSFWQRWCPSPSPLSAFSAPLNMNLTVLILLKGSAQTIMLYPLTFTLIINCANFAVAKDSVTRVSTLGARQAVSLWKTGFDKYLFPQLFVFTNICFQKYLYSHTSKSGQIQKGMPLLGTRKGFWIKKYCIHLTFLIVLRILDMDVSSTSHSLFSDLLLLPLFVQQWPGDEKSQCWPC